MMKKLMLISWMLVQLAQAEAQSGSGATTPHPVQPASYKVLKQLNEDIAAGKKIWMLTYFRQRYPTRIEIDEKGNTVEVPLPDPMQVEKLHIALSTDGRNWRPINDNNPVWEHFMRDPFVRKGADGVWRLLATGGARGYDRKANGPGCLYASSKDLVHWRIEATLPLMNGIVDSSGLRPARNIWAPEWFYDEKKKEYMLFWSSSFEDAGWKRSRLWYCTTKDWQTFSTARILFQPTYSVIDGTILEEKGTYYLYHKEEEFGAQTGERRAIRVATSSALTGPFKIIDGPMNKGQIVPVITEGPTVMKDPAQPGWLLLYDYCMTNRFGLSSSPDLLTWKVEEAVSFPADARHGTVTQISAQQARALLNLKFTGTKHN